MQTMLFQSVAEMFAEIVAEIVAETAAPCSVFIAAAGCGTHCC